MDKIIKEALKETAQLYSVIIYVFVVITMFLAIFVILSALFGAVGLFVALLFTIFGLPFVIIFMATLSEIGDNNGRY